MKWLWWRRKSKAETAAEAVAEAEALVSRLAQDPPVPPAPSPLVERSQVPTKPLAPPIEPHDALLLFARDYLIARGARVRVESDDLVSATFSDGTSARYTTTLARARAEEETQLLVRGGGVLAALIDECTEHARITALRLAPVCDAVAMAREACAAPATGCASCTSSVSDAPDDDALSVCERCPLRDDHFALAGLRRATSARVQRQWEALGIELTYLLTSNDRRGKHSEWLRVAFDLASGAPLAPLPADRPLMAEASLPPSDQAARIEQAETWAEARLARAVDAAAILLRLRSAGEFLAKLDDIRHTHERLRREHSEEHSEEQDAITSSLDHEVERLRDIYAVDVSASLESVAFITTPMAEVLMRAEGAGELAVTVDLGRGSVNPLTCVICGAASHAGRLCTNGHLTCPRCRAAAHESSCPVCAGASPHPPLVAVGTTTMQLSPESVTSVESTGALTIAHLDAMTPDTWLSFVSWLLEHEGIVVERSEPAANGYSIHGRLAELPLVAVALRPPEHWSLDESDIQRAAAAGTGAPGASVWLITTAPATTAARTTAARLSLRLLDRQPMREMLGQLSSAHLTQREATQHDTLERAESAIAVRGTLLATIQAMEEQLAAAVNTRRAAGGKSVAAAAATITTLRNEVSRAFLAWETLNSDWGAVFGEQEARDGTLAINATSDQLRELGERAEHLRDVTLESFNRFAMTQGTGDLGYGAWRKAILEEWTARCEALRWRLLAIDPAAWQDFRQTHDVQAQENAAIAETAASHAAARVQKAQAQMESRARLPGASTASK